MDKRFGFLVVFVLALFFVNSCEDAQLSPGFPYDEVMGEIPEDDVPPKGDRTTICENYFLGDCNRPVGDNVYEVVCSVQENLQCSPGPCYVAGDSSVCGFYDPSIGNCFCIDDGECHAEYGEDESNSPIDCGECEPGETTECNTEYPGVCSEGVRTCSDEGVWGECVPGAMPGDNQEDCDDVDLLDEDCDGSYNRNDADCYYDACDTSDSCVDTYCPSNDGDDTTDCEAECVVDADCVAESHLECNTDLQCVEVSGPGVNECGVDADCVEPVEVCELLETSLEFEGEYVIEGDGVGLYVYGDSDCDGKSVAFEVFEKDVEGDNDGVDSNPSNANFVQEGDAYVAHTTWVAEYQDDEDDGGLPPGGSSLWPEYGFNSSLVSDPSENITELAVVVVAPIVRIEEPTGEDIGLSKLFIAPNQASMYTYCKHLAGLPISPPDGPVYDFEGGICDNCWPRIVWYHIAANNPEECEQEFGDDWVDGVYDSGWCGVDPGVTFAYTEWVECFGPIDDAPPLEIPGEQQTFWQRVVSWFRNTF